MARSTSYAVTYIILVISVFIADVVLTMAYTGFVASNVSWVPRVVEEFSSGLVYGAYSISPYIVQAGTSVAVINGLNIVLLNPNPFNTEVILLGYYPGIASTYKVLDLGTSLGIVWDGGSPPNGVKEVYVDWIQGGRYKGLFMSPHTSASFTIPSYYGLPSNVFACTKTGCVKLETVGKAEIDLFQTSSWLIGSETQTRTQGGISVDQTWVWRAETIGGDKKLCTPNSLFGPGSGTITTPIYSVVCCSSCPQGYGEIDYKPGRNVCLSESGTMISFSLSHGFPPTVIAGFFSTDPSFTFSTPSTVYIGSYQYRLYGFNSSTISQNDYSQVVTEWSDYPYQDCLRRKVIIEMTVSSNRGGSLTPFSMVWKSSEYIYIYVSAKGAEGYRWYMFPKPIKDHVNVTVYATGTDGYEYPVGSLVSTNEFVDNSADLSKWKIPAANYVKIRVVVEYTMIGTETFCFYGFLGWYNCGQTYDRPVRLAFYVELIPSEYVFT